MQFRNPAVVIDETIANLEYLSEFLLDDIDHGALDPDKMTSARGESRGRPGSRAHSLTSVARREVEPRR